MIVIALLGLIFLLAFLVETIVEFLFGTVAGFFPAWQCDQRTKTSIIQTAAVMVGAGGAFLYRFDILYLYGVYSQIPDIPITAYGIAITGIAIGKGSNYIHELISKMITAKA
jgi:uncharacterized membrane protein (UPF0182 family)